MQEGDRGQRQGQALWQRTIAVMWDKEHRQIDSIKEAWRAEAASILRCNP